MPEHVELEPIGESRAFPADISADQPFLDELAQYRRHSRGGEPVPGEERQKSSEPARRHRADAAAVFLDALGDDTLEDVEFRGEGRLAGAPRIGQKKRPFA